ncbi:hypothetical protein CDCA_CDCA10G2903 [Cyanidium caldarium]|uniref:diaminopimelate epimerase n=1 Tax=Cyanidium caldarium TaxID=2771 RepID=A0AAV9IX48_CYACA|nr:hypothetical protein CDCA_CDCA10G2903 [Cyanidium caldarium]
MAFLLGLANVPTRNTDRRRPLTSALRDRGSGWRERPAHNVTKQVRGTPASRTFGAALTTMSAVSTTTRVASLPFAKYEGLGNDFILVDERHQPETSLTPASAVRLCDRHFGIGADGVIIALAPTQPDTDLRMRIFNSDGSEPEMCGNGIRCLAKFLAETDADAAPTRRYRVQTLAGLIVPELLPDGQVCVDMGAPVLEPAAVPARLPATSSFEGVPVAVETTLDEDTARLPHPPATGGEHRWQVTAVSMGNPHCILFVDEATWQWADAHLDAIGPQFEHHPAFPQRTNTEFVQVCGERKLRVLVWERGAGRTLACGTGACATVVAAMLAGVIPRTRHLPVSGTGAAPPPDTCLVYLPGGPLHIEWRLRDQHVLMTGPARRVFAGEVST